MLVETDNLVTVEKFRNDLDKYLVAAQEGRGPIAVTRGDEVVGFFVSAEEYEAAFGAAIRTLLKDRENGPTVSHEEVREEIRAITRKGKRKKS